MEASDAATREQGQEERPGAEGPQEEHYTPPTDDDPPVAPSEEPENPAPVEPASQVRPVDEHIEKADDQEGSEDDDLPPRRDPEDVEDIIVPRRDPVPRTVGPDSKGRERVYVQTELTWFTRIELFGLFGRVIDDAMSGDNPLDVGDMMQAMKPQSLIEQIAGQLPGADTSPDAEDRTTGQGMQQASQVLAVFARVASLAPERLKEAYCIILNIPKGHRVWAINHALDAMSPEVGEDILHVFVDQNWEAIEDFFTRVLPKLIKRGRAAQNRFAEGR